MPDLEMNEASLPLPASRSRGQDLETAFPPEIQRVLRWKSGWGGRLLSTGIICSLNLLSGGWMMLPAAFLQASQLWEGRHWLAVLYRGHTPTSVARDVTCLLPPTPRPPPCLLRAPPEAKSEEGTSRGHLGTAPNSALPHPYANLTFLIFQHDKPKTGFQQENIY